MTKRILGFAAMTAIATAGIAVSAAHAESSTKIDGRIYADMSSISEKIDGVKTTKDGFGFDVKRFYLGVDHGFDDIWHVAVTTDFTYSSATGLTDVYIKKAYGEAKISKALDVRIGATDLPWVPFVEGLWGYRYIENVLADRMKFGTSSDWGLHVKGTVGMISYAGAVVNGGEGALEPGDHKLVWRIVPETVTRPAANDRINRFDIQADCGIAAGPQRGEAQIVINTAISKRHAFNAPRAVTPVKRHEFIKGRTVERKRGGRRHRFGKRDIRAREPAKPP